MVRCLHLKNVEEYPNDEVKLVFERRLTVFMYLCVSCARRNRANPDDEVHSSVGGTVVDFCTTTSKESKSGKVGGKSGVKQLPDGRT